MQMQILKITGLLVVLVAAVVLVLAALRPDTFSVSRSIAINAPPERIYPLISDLKAFNTWNPFAMKDPAHKAVYSGPATGTGSKYSWSSDALGVGSMTVAELVPPSKVIFDLDFDKPFAAKNIATFAIEPKDGGSNVTWTMTGPVPFVAKIVHTLVNVDKMVGGDFDAGLTNLKKIAESS